MEMLGMRTNKKESSKNIAKERLKLVLITDRLSCSVQVFENLKRDMLEVLSKYMEVDEGGFEIEISSYEKNTNITTLKTNIPVKKINR